MADDALSMIGDMLARLRTTLSGAFQDHLGIIIALGVLCAVGIAVGWMGNWRRTRQGLPPDRALAALVVFSVLVLALLAAVTVNSLAARSSFERMEEIKETLRR
ncbi:MAG: hypothetical protein AB1405_02230 [Bdellovibrionota bacterium]